MKRLLSIITICAVVFLVSAPAVSARAAPRAAVVHIVRWGETLTGIARRYGTTVWAISRANGIANPSRIYAGQRLWIPGATTPAPGGCVYVVQFGDTLGGIALRHGTSASALASANGIANPNRIYVGQRLSVPCAPAPMPPARWHTVRWGETLSGIALRYGVSVWAIAHANGIANPSLIYTGQRLYIP